MTAPRRLRDDPAFCDELGLDFAAERASLARHDLGGLKARLAAALDAGLAADAGLDGGEDLGDPGADVHGLSPPDGVVDTAGAAASASAGTPAGSAVSSTGAATGATGAATGATGAAAASGGVIGALSGVKGFAIGLAMGTAAGIGGHAVYVEVRAPSTEVVAPAPETPAAPPLDAPDEVSADESVLATPPPKTEAAEPPKTESRRASGSDTAGPKGAPPERAASSLEAQLRLYERGEAALKRGRFVVAIRELEAYRQRFPDGELTEEVELALLEARVGAERFADAEAHARRLLEDRAFAKKRGELMRLRGEALVRLGRCAEAGKVLDAAMAAVPPGLSSAERDALMVRCE